MRARLTDGGDIAMADEMKQFREHLSALTDRAKNNNNRLTVQEIRRAMKDIGLDETKLQMVCTYLNQAGIEVLDPELEEQGESGGAHRPSLEVYLEELSAISRPDDKAEKELFDKAAEKDPQACRILTERYLQTVCDLAGEFEGNQEHPDGFFEAEDLVQEANIGLVTAVSTIEKEETLAAYRAALLNSVSAYLSDSVRRAEEERNSDDRVLNRMNRLAEAVRDLEEELEHKPSLEELSAYLNLPSEEIKDMLRVGGTEMSVDNL